MVKGKTPKGKIKKNRLGVRKRKSKKVKTRATPPTRRPSRRHQKVNNLGLDAEQSLVEQALRGSPDMDKILRENDGQLFVPSDSLEEEGMAVGASAQPKTQADVVKFLGNLKQKYGKPLAAEHAMSVKNLRRSSRPQTPLEPVDPFGDYMKEQQAADKEEQEVERFLNEEFGTTFDTNKSKNEFTFEFPGGKRKSRRRRKKSRRRRKKSRRRKTKRKSSRRRK